MVRQKKRLSHGLSVVTAVIATGLTGGQAMADETTAPGALEEVVVTTRKVSENLQDVPLAISAFTAQALERSNIVQFWDLTSRVPSLQYYEFNVGLPRYYMRGIGSDSSSGATDPDVGVFADDVYIGRASGTSGDFLDLERVEVLRGPQGTLFGRNVVGGAIALFAQKPTREFDWSAGADVGNYGRFNEEGMLNAPLNDAIAIRLAVSHKSESGYASNTLSGARMDDQNRLAARASILFEPSEDFSLLLRAEYGRDRALGQWWNLASPSEFAAPYVNANPRSGDNPENGFNRRQDRNATVTLNWTTALGTLTAISAYRGSSYDARENATGLQVPQLTDPNRFFDGYYTLFIEQQDQAATQYSQELRLSGKPIERLQLVGGLYYLNENVGRLAFNDYRFIFFDSQGEGGWYARSRLNSYAVFGQGQLSFTERWRLTAGARWTKDERAVNVQTFGQDFIGFTDSGVPVDQWVGRASGNWSEMTPMASLSYLPQPDVNIFATVSRGFKSGGFDDANPERQAVIHPFNPELAWDYELGVKSELLEHRLRVNANVFYIDYKDLQLDLISQPNPNLPPFAVAGNAGKAKIHGVELEWDWAATAQLTIYGNYAYNHNQLRDVFVDSVDYSGKRLPYAPTNKVSSGVSYFVPSPLGLWGVRADVSYQGSQFAEITNSPLTRIAGYALMDAGLSWSSSSRQLKVELWGKNLANRLYWTAASGIPPGDAFVKYGPPRTYGLSLKYHFQ